ncbi:alpha/beta hydrolase [Paenibacillus sp. GCM10027626]|uniref:alpha/beta hydrolase n=1 Tax=Paenibacillus sp. GCM10027626 TaxID=3273411 RepID=UPI0036430EDC
MHTDVTANVRRSKFRNSFGDWLLVRLKSTFEYDRPYWRYAMIGLWAVYAAMLVVTALGMPTGLGVLFDTITFAFWGTITLGAAGCAAAFLLTLAYVPLPRFFIGSMIFVGIIIYTIFYNASLGVAVAAVLALLLTGTGALCGMLLAIIIMPGQSVHARAASLTTAVLMIAAAFIGIDQRESILPVSNAGSSKNTGIIAPLSGAGPAELGAYNVLQLNYGSGRDQHRDIFADQADLITVSADASGYIKEWPWLRKLFWGFDETALPINGRVWLPEGEGPFPLALIVHGNHLMEQFSDGGYSYLGELLASRGTIAVSVDENFLNYSVWSGIPNDDMKMRAWILLKHLQQIEAFNGQSGNPFYRKVDLQRVALIGHSRGGQAVAMAADSRRWFANDESLADWDRNINVQSVIAIAPTDKQVDKQSAVVKQTNYLTIQGAMDGDVNNFYGDRQFKRTSFAADSGLFKASLYIGEANHSRFNSSWGSMDDSLPGGLLLNRHTMKADDQQAAARVYVSAFIESTLHGNHQFDPLFRDYRYGMNWLPEAAYINRYEDSSFVSLASFEEDQDKTTAALGSKAEAEGVQWTEADVLDRERNKKGTRAVLLEWSDSKGGFYSIRLSDQFRKRLADRKPALLTFSLSNLERDLPEQTEGASPPPKVQIELEMDDGSRVMLPLDEFMPVIVPPHSQFTIADWLEPRMKSGKYKESAEPVFQTYRLPLEQFEKAGFPVEASRIAAVSFYFQREPGKMMIDDIGFAN